MGCPVVDYGERRGVPHGGSNKRSSLTNSGLFSQGCLLICGIKLSDASYEYCTVVVINISCYRRSTWYHSPLSDLAHILII